MKAIKKPIPIDVEEFQPDRRPWPLGVVNNVTGDDLTTPQYQVWNALHSSWITIQPGDYVNVVDGQDLYPIDRATFERTYDIVEARATVAQQALSILNPGMKP